MPDDLDRRMQRLDDVPTPDLWPRVTSEGPARPVVQPSPGRRVAIAATAIVLAAAAFTFLAVTFRAVPPNVQTGVRLIFEANGTVIDRDGGPTLCAGVVLDSLPPQCEGIPLRGWDWSAVDGEQHSAGTTWGEYHVVGSYDGSSLSVTATGPAEPPSPTEADPFQTPCPRPAGGWSDEDPSMTGEDDRGAAIRLAEEAPDHTGVWVDYIADDPDPRAPGPYVLNATFTGDLRRHEAELRRVWGGPLCVSASELTFRELRRIQAELSGGGAAAVGLEVTWSDIDVMEGQVEIGAVVVTSQIQSALDERYGVDTVRVEPLLSPVELPTATSSSSAATG